VGLRRFVSLITVVSVLAVLGVIPALGCSITGQPALLYGLKEGLWAEGSGVYEQETVAWAPSILIVGETTASVVTRYWGEPPANVGVQYEGGGWFAFLSSLGGDSCAGLLDSDGDILYHDGRVGTIGYGVAPPPSPEVGPGSGPEEQAAAGTVPWHRSAPSLELEPGGLTGPLSANELTALGAVYGSPQTVDVSTTTRTRASIAVWRPTLFTVSIFVLGLWFTVRRMRLHRSDAEISRQANANSP